MSTNYIRKAYCSKPFRRVHFKLMRIQTKDTPPPPGKSKVTVGFLRNTGTDPPREAIGPIGPNSFSMEVSTALCEICWWLKLKLKRCPPRRIFSGPAHASNPLHCITLMLTIVDLLNAYAFRHTKSWIRWQFIVVLKHTKQQQPTKKQQKHFIVVVGTTDQALSSSSYKVGIRCFDTTYSQRLRCSSLLEKHHW